MVEVVRRTGEQSRAHILDVVTKLFYQRGIRAVGMDTVVREAGVGNATLYRQFQTKDALATAFVQGRADAWFARMRQVAGEHSDPRERMLAVFEVVANDTCGAAYRGCPMLNTNTEFPEGGHPAHLVAMAHKQQVRDWFHALAVEAEADDPDRLADELLIVLNGAYSTTAVLPDGAYGTRSLELVRRLIAEACARR